MTAPTTLEITNHMRLCSVFEFRTKLDQLEKSSLRDYAIVVAFLTSLEPDPKFKTKKKFTGPGMPKMEF